MADLIDRQAAIDELGYCQTYLFDSRDKDKKISLEDAEYAIEQLPSAQPENAYCIYCHEDSDGYVKPIEKNCHAFIRFGMDGWEISLSAKGWSGSAKIMYCPMCGRKLKNDKR
jgi:hypothetical protein